MPPPFPKSIIPYLGRRGKKKEVIPIKKMGRPTDNPRTERIGFRMSPEEIEDLRICAEALGAHRVDAVVEAIKLLKIKLNIK